MATQPDRLSEALLGLCLLASKEPRLGQVRLVAEFRRQYPEIALVDTRDAKAWEDQLVREWAGDALQGLLTANVDITTQNLPDIPEEPAARAAFDYAQAMLTEYKRRRS
jgi:hypothetical protein